MSQTRKITVFSVITEGIGIGVKNIASLLLASLLWIVTIWIPFLNVGTTIAMSTIPIELSKGKIISPLFIFDEKYRKYMGEYFTLKGMMWLSILPAMFFMMVPGIIIQISWSLALFILLDKGIAPGEAMIRSNKVTYGYKWVIFGVSFLLAAAFFVLGMIFFAITSKSPGLMLLLMLLLVVIYNVATLGCNAVIYRNLTSNISEAD